MKNGANFLFTIFLSTILLMRTGVILIPDYDLKIFGTIIHHFWFGIALILLSAFASQNKVLLFGIGLGLTLDQITYMALGAGGDAQYWSIGSAIGPAAGTIILLLTRETIYKKIYREGKTTS